MLTLIETPAYPEPLNPAVINRWLATESPNYFVFSRRDFLVTSISDDHGNILLNLGTGVFTGNEGDSIALYDAAADQMLTGTVVDIPDVNHVLTDIPYNAAYNITYFNDHTLFAGYYVEGRLTINNVLNPISIISSPDSFGIAQLDVSGVLRTVTSLGKNGDYLSRLRSEPNKSGKFSLEYRECWYGSSEAWHQAEGVGSPESVVDWWYCQAVRSEEQGSNLQEYVMNEVKDGIFLNSFDRPVYFRGLPFDISFIDPLFIEGSPGVDLIVTIDSYNAAGALVNHVAETINTADMDGFLNSLNLDTDTVPAETDFCTVEVEVL